MDEPPVPQYLVDVQGEVTELGKKFGTTKINLVYGEEGGSEGVWACPADQESHDRLDNNSSRDEIVYVRLQNQPLGWANALNCYLVKARTRGSSRAQALESEQFDDPKLDAVNEPIKRVFVEWRRAATAE